MPDACKVSGCSSCPAASVHLAAGGTRRPAETGSDDATDGARAFCLVYTREIPLLEDERDGRTRVPGDAPGWCAIGRGDAIELVPVNAAGKRIGGGG